MRPKNRKQLTSDERLIRDLKTQQDVGLSSVARPKPGQVKYADQLIHNPKTGDLTSVSNKSRDFATRAGERTTAELNTVRNQVATDVRELFTKYGGRKYIRRKGHPLYGKRKDVNEVVLVYDQRLIPRDVAETIIAAARAEAARLNRGRKTAIVFHIAIQ
jgi:hypothetical protein